jgi:hypothetical protein
MPIPVRAMTSTRLANIVQQAVEWSETDDRPLTVRCGLGVYFEGDFRTWPGVRWIVELKDATEAVALTQTLNSFYRAVATGRLDELKQTLDTWEEGQVHD